MMNRFCVVDRDVFLFNKPNMTTVKRQGLGSSAPKVVSKFQQFLCLSEEALIAEDVKGPTQGNGKT